MAIIATIIALVVGVIGAVIVSTVITTSSGNFTGLNSVIVPYIVTFFVLGLMVLAAGMALMGTRQ